MKTKVIILSAPSGSGKTTIAQSLLEDQELSCCFSVSATSRQARAHEKNGEHYYFIDPETFREYISKDMFVEWEEVYPDQFYGTLRSELDRLTKAGRNILFDVDVKGGIRLKQIFEDNALSIFIMPPSIDELKNRLLNRKTETEETLQKRIQRAESELACASDFDIIIINDDLEKAIEEARHHVGVFVGKFE